MSNEVSIKDMNFSVIEQALVMGNIAGLKSEERVLYVNRLCEQLGLNPITKPFEYIQLNGKLTLYATKGCAEQLRAVHKMSINITDRKVLGDIYVVTARSKTPDGREDESTGAVSIKGIQGEMLANAYMKAETKAKRRVTLSHCGLNMFDETEVQSIAESKPEIKNVTPPPVQPQAPKIEKWIPSDAQLKRLFAISNANGYSSTEAGEYMRKNFGVTSSRELSKDQYDQLCAYMEKNPVQKEAPKVETQPELKAVGPTFDDFENADLADLD